MPCRKRGETTPPRSPELYEMNEDTYALQLDNGRNGLDAPGGSAEEICFRFPSAMGANAGSSRWVSYDTVSVHFRSGGQGKARIRVNALDSLSNVNNQTTWAIDWCKSAFNEIFHDTAVLVAEMPVNEYVR